MTDTTDFAAYDAIVVGAGFAGATIARELAERSKMHVAILEQRDHIGGNAYDELDDTGVLVHAYGPHIFHTNSKRVYDYLSRFTKWYDYSHEVLADIHGTYTPVPFNFNSIELHFPADEARAIEDRLLDTYDEGTKVPILKLRESSDGLLHKLADFIYENVFLHYTMKQWGQTPEEIDPSVSARVPVFVGRDNRYFQDTYQGMPADGYTQLFNNMLAYDNIDVFLNTNAKDVLEFAPDTACGGAFDSVNIGGDIYNGIVVYTGPLDFLVNTCFGMLPYRSLDFIYKPVDKKHVLPCGTVNYTVSEDYTRITEYTYLTGQDIDHTTIMEEYPMAFEGKPGQIPYYAIMNDENNALYERYLELFKTVKGFHALGRLAEYRYYNMDQIVERALDLADELSA